MSVPPPAPPSKKFVPRTQAPAPAPAPRPAAAEEPKLAEQQQAALGTTLNPNQAAAAVSAVDTSRRSPVPNPPAQQQQQQQHQQQQQQHFNFDKEDVEALRSENRMLHTRLAAFLEFQQSTNASISSDSVSTKGLTEAEIGSMMTAMKARIRQLELALAWECSRREEAEERCFALMRRTSANP